MSIIQNRSLFNLYSLYNTISKCECLVSKVNDLNYVSIKTLNSSWPNANYCFKENIFENEEKLKIFDFNIKNKKMPLLSINNYSNQNNNLLKEYGFYIIDKWTCMNLNLINFQNSNSTQGCFEVTSKKDLEDFLTCTENVLFHNKGLNIELFRFLLNSNIQLFAYKQNGQIVATTLTYIDENQVVGIYMVATKKEFQGKGIGKKIMNYTIQTFANKGFDNFTLQSTIAGRKLYNNLGFKEEDTINLIYKLK